MSDWKEITLSEHLDLISGFAFKSTNFKNSYEDGLMPVIKIKNVANGDVNLNDVQFHEYSESFKRFLVSKGDVLIAMTGNHPQAQTQVVGDVSRYKLDNYSLLNQRVGKIISKDETSLDFVYYLFKSDEVKNKLANSSSGSANQANISKNDILNLQVKLPLLKEQNAIASALSSLDDKIDLLHRQNKTLEQMAETLFRKWFVESADEGWEVGVLEDEFEFMMGQSPAGNTLNENKTGMNFYQGRSDFGFRFPEPRVYTTAPTRIAKPLDTLVSVRAPVGDMNMALERCCLGRGVAAFRYKINNGFYSYTYYKMRSLMESIKQFEDNGSVFGSIGKEDFRKLRNVIPPDSAIERFQNQVQSIDDKIILNSKQIQSLIKLRDTLLPKLMNGKVRIKI